MIRALLIACLPFPAWAQSAPTAEDVLALFATDAQMRLAIAEAQGQAGNGRDFGYRATLDGCLLTWRVGVAPDVFGTEMVMDLGGADIATGPGFGGEPAFDRVRLDSSHETLRRLAPAMWAFMGGSAATMPDADTVVARYKLFDPFGAAEWWDPSMMTPFQQRQAEARWAAALAVDENALAARHNGAWFGPERADGWVPNTRAPGAFGDIVTPADGAEAAAQLIRDYVAATCSGTS